MTDVAPAPEADVDVAVDVAEADPHALNDAHAAMLERFVAEMGDAVLEQANNFGTPVLRIRRDSWRRAAEVAKAQGADYLSFVSAIDWSPAPKESDDDSGDTSTPAQPMEETYGVAGSEGRFQVFAHVQSTRVHTGLTLKVDVDAPAAEEGGAPGMLAESWVPVYPGADWHEREAWEMFGISFEGHPAIRHLYLPNDFEGFPLRKDFPLLSRVVKPWPGLVDVEAMPEDEAAADTPADPGADAPADATAAEGSDA
ncbi:MAG: NADH-quinone oxidoreductase subunit C [Acidimicrobiia bacterium]